IVKGDNTNLAADAKVSTVNLALHTLFKDVVLKDNLVIVNQATGTYPYRAYMETVYTYSTAAKNGAVGAPQLYYKETAGKFNSFTANVNSSLKTRISKFATSLNLEKIEQLTPEIGKTHVCVVDDLADLAVKSDSFAKLFTHLKKH
uniref:Uncharacterized protein n=1 Tax=Romanomermis culicivorax TaxID=13658 RepID=A0A915HZP7_ROMCU